MSDFLDRIASLSPKRLALLALELHTELEELRNANAEPIAVVGIGCRFPGGASGPDAFWQRLLEGIDAVTEVPKDRWDIDRFYDPDPDTSGKMYSRHGAFIEHVDRFDAPFFGISPREAAQMDPQQRLVLEVAWEALEHAGQSPGALAQTATGVFLGVCTYDYSLLQLSDPRRVETYASSGAAPSILSNRVSYLLDLQGPSLTVDTACSSSLVTVHLACQSLRRKECDVALAGGVNLMLSPITTIALCKGRMLAADGRCKTFDARADGYVRGEGCGIVVLRRLSDAIANGDCICALIRGSAVNQDGYGNGLTAPNLLAQQAVIRRALDQAQVRPEQVGYIETHGTGTALGDPIEVQALETMYGAMRQVANRCAIGSVKTNIGHLEGAAGIAGLIKTVLALQHQAIPPHLHYRQLNPHISFENTPFFIPTDVHDWRTGPGTRYAATSSFGFGGTNAHVVLSEAPSAAVVAPSRAAAGRPLHIFTLSAKSESALVELAGRHKSVLESTTAEWPDVCFTANTGRSHFSDRLAVVSESARSAYASLERFLAGEAAPGLMRSTPDDSRKAKVAFLFTGQGAQYAGMGQRLYDGEPAFRAALEKCDALLRPYLDRPLLSVLYPHSHAESVLDQTAYAQPALFALEYALTETWRSWGVTPGAVLGHSIGEYSAACAAGVLGLEDALKLVAVRGRLMQALPPNGAMAVVFADEAVVADIIGPFASELSIAAINGPAETVVSGDSARLNDVLQDLETSGIQTRRLTVSHAFHSPLMEPVLDRLEAALASVELKEPRLGFISNLTGRPVERGVVTEARYWRRHARQPVRFAAGLRALQAQGYRLFVEVGPQPVLSALGAQSLPEECAWLPSLRRGTDDWQQLLNSLAMFYTHGGNVDWRGFDSPYTRRRVALPTYPFQPQHYRLGAGAGVRTPPMEFTEWLYELHWQPRPLPQTAAATLTDSPGRWLILGNDSGVGTALSNLLRASGEECALVQSDATQDSIDRLAREGWRGVVDLRSLNTALAAAADGAAAASSATQLCAGVLDLMQRLASMGATIAPRLWFITRGATEPSELSDVVGASLVGLRNVIALEHPELRCTTVDLDDDTDESAAAMLLGELLATDSEERVRWKSGARYGARLAPLDINVARSREQPVVSAHKTYLLTGGLGALGIEVGRWLVQRGARHLALVGRKGPAEPALAAIREWEQAGVTVAVFSADVARLPDISNAFDELRRTQPPLGGIVHAAGVLDDGILLQQTPERFARVLAPKFAGAWNLHALTHDLQLDFFVLFSSMASLLGSAGQGNYAAANACLDAFARYRRALGLPGISINWGPWASAGMAASQDTERQQRRAGRGIGTIAREEGIEILEQLLNSASPQVGVVPVEWRQFLEQFDGAVPSVLAHVAPRGVAADAKKEQVELREQLERVPPSRRHERLVKRVRQHAIGVLGLDTAYPIDANAPLKEIGVDSLMAIELARKLSADTGRPFPATLVFTHSTLAAIASFLLTEVFPEEPAELSPAPSLEGLNA